MSERDEESADVPEEISRREVELLGAAPPPEVSDLATAAVRFVQRSVGVELDFTVETLPILDHYLAEARGTLQGKDRETLLVVAHAAGAYLGEVIRRRFPSFWVLTPADPTEHRVQFMRLFLTVKPVTWVLEALEWTEADGAAGELGLVLDAEDRAFVTPRLAELPEVDDEEFVRPSTRVEVLDIVVDAITARQSADGDPPLSLEPEDYLDG